MERPLHTRAGFWVGVLGPALLTLLVLVEFNKSHPAAPNVAGFGAVVMGFLGAVVLGLVWLWVMLHSRAWRASLTGAALGVGLALGVALVHGHVRAEAQHRAWAQASTEEAIERQRLLLALDAARRDDKAGIRSALAMTSSFQPTESMCALVATPSRSLYSVLDGAAETRHTSGDDGTGVDNESLLRIAAEMVSDEGTLQTKQSMLFVLLEALAARHDGAAMLPAWRTLWERAERQAGIASTWPPAFADSGSRTYRDYCGGGTDAALIRMIQYMTPQQEPANTDAVVTPSAR
ncbi:hypothetical protein ABB26_11560 [Stenotrophomonas humi]|uniref:Transmembrane protein n=1 Tax=Stenotrophomonas humi TaxID=405444 RepID=A0A0R0CBC8_9GAMM|nr:hypothetical protein [Stenotrophomonas humi]KRG63550.1 hypothetical protein ABB26_11560 [Stenotrophomonas humi]